MLSQSTLPSAVSANFGALQAFLETTVAENYYYYYFKFSYASKIRNNKEKGLKSKSMVLTKYKYIRW